MSQLHSSEPNVVMLAAEAVPFAKVGDLPTSPERCHVRSRNAGSRRP